MGLVNVIDVPTPSGIKTIEVHQDDLTTCSLKIDVLLISSFGRSYVPTPGTLIGALKENCGISVEELSEAPLLDLRDSMDCWISQRIDGKPFKYIACVENLYSGNDTEELNYDNVFAALSLLAFKDATVKTVGMPILGAGLQNPDYKRFLPILIDKAIRSIQSNTTLSTIYFVERSTHKVTGIDNELNKYLNRSDDNLEMVSVDATEEAILEEVLKKLVRIQQSNEPISNSDTLNTFISSVTKRQFRIFELGILSRKLIELLLSNLVDSEGDQRTLYDSITLLKDKKVNDWMLTYLHTIRVFGNSFAHESKKGIPTKMNRTDVIVLLYALNRALDLALDHKEMIRSTK